MSRTRIWFARDCWLTSDFKVERVGLEFGAEGVLAFEEVLALMKLEGAEDGTVAIPFTLLARRCFIRKLDRARAIVQALSNEGLVELVSSGKNEFTVQLPRWARWQTGDPRNAERQAKLRQRRGGSNGHQALFADGDDPKAKKAGADDAQLVKDFEDWLADHAAVTGRTPPGEKTKVRQSLLASYRARREEEYSAEQLKLATRGAHANDFRRENGYDKAESVLRPTKIHDLVEDGRRLARATTSPAEEAARDRERLEKAGLA